MVLFAQPLEKVGIRSVRQGFVLRAIRAGIEGTHAQAIRRSRLRRSANKGLAKTRLQHVITEVAINLLRIASWASGTALAKTRCSHFAGRDHGGDQLYFPPLDVRIEGACQRSLYGVVFEFRENCGNAEVSSGGLPPAPDWTSPRGASICQSAEMAVIAH